VARILGNETASTDRKHPHHFVPEVIDDLDSNAAGAGLGKEDFTEIRSEPVWTGIVETFALFDLPRWKPALQRSRVSLPD
jgi:hypothetical protein